MKSFLKLIVVVATLFAAQSAFAMLNLLACEPEWGALSKELGGDKVNVFTAVNALQDPHHIEARPSLMARARNADLIVCTGADLEIGWMPLLQTQSGNPKIQRGQSGYFESASYVSLIEVPERLDRAMGDVHPQGNPHVHMDPRNIAKIGVALTERLIQIDPGESEYYRARAKAFNERWQQAITRWEKEAAPLKGLPIVVYHKNMSYLNAWLGMREVGSLEPKPGVPPTTGHMTELLARLAKDPARAIVRSAYNDPRAGEWLSERAKIPAVMLPFMVGGTDKAKDLFGLFDDTIARLLPVAK
jgi:zinc/manganese transport system substrate-binding protein